MKTITEKEQTKKMVPVAVRLPEDIHLQLKLEAVKAKMTLKSYIAEILKREAKKSKKESV